MEPFHLRPTAPSTYQTIKLINVDHLLRLNADSCASGEPGDEVAEFFTCHGAGEAGWHGRTFVDAFFNDLDGNLADFSGDEVAQANRTIVF